jgi:hypothetical protein
MESTWIRRWLPVVIVGVFASVGVAACGDDDEGEDIAAYCDFSAELDAQDSFPTDEQLDEIADLAPEEISDDIDDVVALIKEEGEAAFENPDIEELFAPIDDFEAENCDIAEGS